jgi:glycosyltransferase involved in cell wall biosynthesis
MKSIVIIPAFNEELSIGKVVSAVPKDLISEVVVVNNNSSDDTVNAARSAGATVLNEIVQGYGASCLTGIDYVNKKKCDIVVFMDGDYSDFPEQTKLLVEPIIQDNYDFVLGSRILGNREKGALPIQSRIGSIISSFLIKLFWKVKYTDLGPFRAIKLDMLLELNMKDKWYGWTVEMQIKAAKKKYKILEIPVSYRKRIGKSKVTGTLKGTFMASLIILKTIFVQLFKD